MADWIKWVGGLEDRAEVIAIAQRLNLPPVHVAGACCVLWLWARQEGRVTGNRCHVRHATVESCDRQVAVNGFGEAMKAVEWLVDEDGGITFPRWNVHNSDSAKQRAMAAQRQANKRWRAVTRTSRSRHAPVTQKALPDQIRSDQIRVDKTSDSESDSGRDSGVYRHKGGVGGNGSALHVTVSELRETPRLLALFAECAAAGLLEPGGASEANRLAFVAAAEHCLRVGSRNRGGMFAEQVRKWPRALSYVTVADEESARARLRDYPWDGRLD